MWIVKTRNRPHPSFFGTLNSQKKKKRPPMGRGGRRESAGPLPRGCEEARAGGGALFVRGRVAGPGRPALPFGAGRVAGPGWLPCPSLWRGEECRGGAAGTCRAPAAGARRARRSAGTGAGAARETGYVGNPFVNRRLFCLFVGRVFIVSEKSCAMWGEWCCRAQRALPWWGALCGILPVIPILWGFSPFICTNSFCLWGGLRFNRCRWG